MRSIFKKILIFVMVICVLWYAMEGNAAELKGVNLNKIGLALNERDKLVNLNNTNTRKELALVNIEHGLSQDYNPEGLTMPNISFATGVNQEEKYVAGIIAKPLEELVATSILRISEVPPGVFMSKANLLRFSASSNLFFAFNFSSQTSHSRAFVFRVYLIKLRHQFFYTFSSNYISADKIFEISVLFQHSYLDVLYNTLQSQYVHYKL